jgi:hypothetical protein
VAKVVQRIECRKRGWSEREYQLERGPQWDKGKGCDTFGPIGPWLVTHDEIENVQRLDMWLDVNGQRMQTGNTKTMIFNCATLVSYVSQFMTLMPGDVITTGTAAEAAACDPGEGGCSRVGRTVPKVVCAQRSLPRRALARHPLHRQRELHRAAHHPSPRPARDRGRGLVDLALPQLGGVAFHLFAQAGRGDGWCAARCSSRWRWSG